MHDYAARVFEEQQKKAPWEKEFLQSVEEVFASLDDVLKAHPEYEENCILERMVTPERIITFQVPWQSRLSATARLITSRTRRSLLLSARLKTRSEHLSKT